MRIILLIACATVPAFAGVTTVVPEPGTMLLVGGGIIGTILIMRRRRK